MGRNTKRKKNYYLAPSKRHRLDSIPGTVGFLGTCNTHEDVCVKEGYSLLNLYGDQLYGPEPKQEEKKDDKSEQSAENAVVASPAVPEESSDEEDVDAALKKEVSSLQSASNKSEDRAPRRFQAMRCGTANNVFFRTSLTDPLPTLVAAMEDILSSGKQRTRHLIRMVPVHAVCKAYLDKIEKALTSFCTDRFKGHSKTFYAVVKVMSNSSLKKDEVLSLVLRVMDQVAPECKPVLTKDADVAVVVSVLVTNCYIGEAPLYLDKYKKYNLIELASPAAAAAPGDEDKKAMVPSKDGEVNGGSESTPSASKGDTNTAEEGEKTLVTSEDCESHGDGDGPAIAPERETKDGDESNSQQEET